MGYQGNKCVVEGIEVFVMPSSSARVKAYSYEMKLKILRDIKAHIDKLKTS